MATTAAQLEATVSVKGVSTAKSDLAAVSSESDKAQANLNKVGKEASDTGKKAEEGSGGLKGFLGDMLGITGGITAASLASGAFDTLKEQVIECVKAGEDFQQTQALTIQALKSTHDASGMTVQGIDDLAESLAKVTPYSAESIQSAENVTLAFTHIGKDIFPQVTQAALDMSARFGIDVPTAARLLGRALDDPAKGASALSRYTGQLTDAQKKQIATMEKSGNLAGAQGVILDLLKTKVGGAAQAMGQTFAGSIQIAQNQLEIAREKIGSALLPVLARLMQSVAPLVSALADKLPGAIDFLGAHIQQIMPFVAGFGITIAAVVIPALISLLAPMAAAALGAVAMALPFIAVGLAIGLVITYFKHLYDTSVPFRTAVNELVAVLQQLASVFVDHLQAGLSTLLPYLQQAAQWIGGELAQAGKALEPVILQAVTAIRQFASELSTRLGPAIDNVFTFIRGALIILGQLWSAAWPTMQAVLEGVWNVIQGVVKIAWSIVSGIIKVGLDLLGGNWRQAWTDLKDMLSGVWAGIQQAVGGALHAVIALVTGLLGGLVSLAEIWGQNLIKAFANGITNSISMVKNAATGVINGVKGLLGFHSPAEEGPGADADTWAPNLMRMFASGITDSTPLLSNAAAAAMGGVKNALTGGVSGSAAAGLVSPSAGAQLAQSLATAASAGSASGAANGQPVVLVLDGLTLGRAMLPYIGQAARISAGIRTS